MVDEELLEGFDIIQHQNSAFADGDEMLAMRDLKLKLIED